MTTFAFTATVSGLDLNSASQLDALYTDDFMLVPSSIDGVTSIDVEIDAASGEEALRLFLDHLSRTDIKIERVLEDLVNVPEIADRLDVNRETVRTWVAGTRGPADFPSHRMVVGNQKLWTWCAVHAWASVHGRLPQDEPEPLDSACVDWINGQLAPQPAVHHSEPERTTWLYYVVDHTSIDESWVVKDTSRVKRAAPRRLDTRFAARDGAHWSYTSGHIEKAHV